MATGKRVRSDLSSGTLGAALTDSGTTITFSSDPGWPTISGSQYRALTINNVEIVHLTAYTATQTTGTIERGQEGTAGVAHGNGDPWVHAPTVQDFRLREAEDVDSGTWNTGDVPVWNGTAFDPEALSAEIGVACSDETTAIGAGTAKTTFRMPHAMTLTSVRASLTTACATGTFTVDINENGTTILSTKLTIDATEKTSTTAATAAVISDANLANDAEITVDVDNAGDGTAKGLKIWLLGTRT